MLQAFLHVQLHLITVLLAVTTVTTVSPARIEQLRQQLPYRWASGLELQRKMQSCAILTIACDEKRSLLANPALKHCTENITPLFRRSGWSRPITSHRYYSITDALKVFEEDKLKLFSY